MLIIIGLLEVQQSIHPVPKIHIASDKSTTNH